jgi:plastocyanin
MKSLSVYFAAAFAILSLYSCGSSDQLDAQSHQRQATVNPTQTVVIPANATGMGANAYGVNPLSVVEGTSVIWQNDDTVAHTATSDTGLFDTGTIQPSASSSPVPFNSPGVFPYYDSIAGAASMSGTIEVTASPSPSPSPSASASVTPSPSPSVTVSPTPTPTPTTTTVPKKG